MAAAKKKGKGAGKKEAKEDEEEKKDEKPQQIVKKDLDLYIPAEFGQSLRERIGIPFIFGPVEFNGLNVNDSVQPWDYRSVHGDVCSKLRESANLPDFLCIHGYKVAVKKRTLKRRSTIVKHSMFLRNLEVYPEFPPEPEPVVPVEEVEEG